MTATWTLDRIRANCTIADAPDACWWWSCTLDKDGYGRVRIDGKNRRVHRVALELATGREIGSSPRAEFATHRCDLPLCCNPAHLSWGDARSNLQDVIERGGWAPNGVPMIAAAAAIKRALTHCKHGHEFTEANTYIDRDGWRRCRACHNEKSRRRRAVKRAQAEVARYVRVLTSECPELIDLLSHEVDAGRMDAADAGQAMLALAWVLTNEPTIDTTSTRQPQ